MRNLFQHLRQATEQIYKKNGIKKIEILGFSANILTHRKPKNKRRTFIFIG
jgi:hypothetical protein